MLLKEYEARRDHIVAILSKLGFEIQCKPQGSVFVFAVIPKNWLHSDVDFVRALIQKAGVAAVPGCGFFHLDSNGEIYRNRYIRFAFCKSEATLAAAARKMQDIANSDGSLQLD
ncbi:putative aminotransferase AatC [Dioscorea cayenensis subsp. rotundata]|uniref:Aminotransferase AatC n=1 Tax=Dioscorea cayennensis subsp. rotundata TaxID=55577 RepID=A0AB40BEJ2_DIOCR|nr:putative aminotransferase AatC [Dioscorea cayenensis subsp. rotundata]